MKGYRTMGFETQVSKHFSGRASRYDSCGNWIRNEDILNAMISEFPISQEKKYDIVDLGTGTGAVITHILNDYEGFRSLVAVDICSEMLDKISDSKIHKYVASLENLPFDDNSFDIAVSRQCLHYVDDLDVVLNEIKRVLRPGGLMVLGQIVPLENGYKDYWNKIMKLRQPLRQRSFSEWEWIQCFTNAGFKVCSVQNFQNRGSMYGWIKKYNVSDKNIIEEYRSMYVHAPQIFKQDYEIEEKEGNVEYTTYWTILSFELEE